MEKLNCRICGKEVYRSRAELRKNKTGNIYCSRECYQSTIKGNGNPNYNNHWSDDQKKQASVKLKEQFRKFNYFM